MQIGKKFGVRSSEFGVINPQSPPSAGQAERQIRNPKSNGFTLIEAIITIVIVGIISSIAALIILEGMKAGSKEQNLSNAHYQARFALEKIARELRSMQGCSTITVATAQTGSFSFIDISGSPVQLRISGTDILRNAIPLASGITTTQPFLFLQRDGLTSTMSCTVPNDIWFVDISLTDKQGADSLPMRTRVHPRNF